MDENGIHGLTGCLASCNKDEFQAELSEIQVEEIESETGSWGGGWDVTEKRSLKVFIHFLNGRYEEKEQYIIYDSNTMIADIGGYMGLLLGYSLLSIYEIAEQMWLKIISMSTRCTRKIEV